MFKEALEPEFKNYAKQVVANCQALANALSKLGYRNYPTKDDSVNCPWLFPLLLGEAWHNNHHGDGRNPNYGRRWWELDPTFWLIKIIEKK
jgi:stearoyl-CoA desaturase (delta-9 desaturase)